MGTQEQFDDALDGEWDQFLENHTCPKCGNILPRLPAVMLLHSEGYQCMCGTMTWKLGR